MSGRHNAADGVPMCAQLQLKLQWLRSSPETSHMHLVNEQQTKHWRSCLLSNWKVPSQRLLSSMILIGLLQLL